MNEPKVGILTPDPGDRDFHSRWRDVLERTSAPLRKAGLRVDGRSWTDPAGIGGFDLVLPLLVWGYHRAGLRWHVAVDDWAGRGIRLRNPPSVLKWNADKLYLGRLANLGVPVVPTQFVERIDEIQLGAASATFETDRLIAKPQISASAWQTIRWSPGSSLEEGPDGAALIQPYLPSIETEGEVSFIYFDGRFSHAIRKRPQHGEFRVQPEYAGIITPHAPDASELEVSERVLAAIDEPLLYARVDLVRGLDGRWCLIELELVEPDLYLEHDAAGGAAFVEAVTAAASGGR